MALDVLREGAEVAEPERGELRLFEFLVLAEIHFPRRTAWPAGCSSRCAMSNVEQNGRASSR